MCEPILGAAIIAGGASLIGGSMSASATRSASRAATEQTNQQMELFREQQRRAEQLLAPYVSRDNTAFRMMQAAIGVPVSPSTQQPAPRPGGGTMPGSPGQTAYGNPQFGGYGAGRYDMAITPDMRVEDDRFGAGRDFDQMPPDGSPGYQVPGQDDGDEIDADYVWSAFEQSPWARIARTASEEGQSQFMGMAGATGSALSGRTARGLTDIANINQQQQFGNWFGQLGGLVDIDMQARSGVASAGQTYASNAAGALRDLGQTQANARIAEGQAWANALGGVGTAAGWYMGQQSPVGTGARVQADMTTNPARFTVPPGRRF